MIYNSYLEVIGNTPLVELKSIKVNNCSIYAKVEMLNPSGSIKIRPAKKMIDEAIKAGLINQDTIIIEPTSGNMGIALALICSVYKLKFIAVIPNDVSEERIKLIKAYGAKVVLTDKALGMKGSVEEANNLKEVYGGFIISQFSNPNNYISHYETAEEIIKEIKADYIICTIGTGGTIVGIGKYYSRQNSNTKIIGVLPCEGDSIDGIGPNFVPEIVDYQYIDKIIKVSLADSIENMKYLSFNEGLFVGISSGAVLAGALQLIEESNLENKKIVIILPDSGYKYLSRKLYE